MVIVQNIISSILSPTFINLLFQFINSFKLIIYQTVLTRKTSLNKLPCIISLTLLRLEHSLIRNKHIILKLLFTPSIVFIITYLRRYHTRRYKRNLIIEITQRHPTTTTFFIWIRKSCFILLKSNVVMLLI